AAVPARPAGNPVATAATAIGAPPRASFAICTRSPYTQTAAGRGQLGSSGCGVRAFATRERTLPGVSAPSRVVRSIIEITVSSPQAFAVVLIDREPSWAARPARPTASTPGSPCRNVRSALLLSWSEPTTPLASALTWCAERVAGWVPPTLEGAGAVVVKAIGRV